MIEVGDIILKVYKVEKVLGVGGSGKVFLVRRTLDGQTYAAKTIHSDKIDSTRLRQDLLREIRVSQKLGDHPHIVPSRFFRMVNGSFVVFSDYVGGGTLHHWIRSGKVNTVEKFLDIAIQTAWGLDVTHSAGIIHKDIKPANVLMEPDGRARVADFGLIRGMTPTFCSPEQASHEKLTTATDMWSWALMLMVMWFGKGKWMIGPQGDQAVRYLGRDEWRLGAAPEALIRLLDHCLQINPADRPLNMLHLAEDLKQIYKRVTGHDYLREEPPEISSCTDSQSQRDRVSVMDGLNWDNPKKLLDEITTRLEASSMDVKSLLPELQNQEVNFVDDLNTYIFIEGILKKLSAQGNPEWLEMLQRVLTLKAWLLLESNDLNGSMEIHRESMEICRELILYHNRMDLWRTMGNRLADIALVHLQLREDDKALENSLAAIELLEKTPERFQDIRYQKDRQTMYGHKGIIHSNLNHPEEAEAAFRQSYELSLNLDLDKASDEYGQNLATTAFNLGSFLAAHGKFEEALKYLKEAADIQVKRADSDRVNEKVLLTKISQTVATTLAQLNRVEEATLVFDKTEAVHRQIQSMTSHIYLRIRFAIFLKNKSYFYREQQRYTEALEINDQAMAIMKELFEKQGTIEHAHLMADILVDHAQVFDFREKEQEMEAAL